MHSLPVEPSEKVNCFAESILVQLNDPNHSSEEIVPFHEPITQLLWLPVQVLYSLIITLHCLFPYPFEFHPIKYHNTIGCSGESQPRVLLIGVKVDETLGQSHPFCLILGVHLKNTHILFRFQGSLLDVMNRLVPLFALFVLKRVVIDVVEHWGASGNQVFPKADSVEL